MSKMTKGEEYLAITNEMHDMRKCHREAVARGDKREAADALDALTDLKAERRIVRYGENADVVWSYDDKPANEGIHSDRRYRVGM